MKSLLIIISILLVCSCSVPPVEKYCNKDYIFKDQNSNQTVIKHFSEDFTYIYLFFGIWNVREPLISDYLMKKIDENKADGVCNLVINDDMPFYQYLLNIGFTFGNLYTIGYFEEKYDDDVFGPISFPLLLSTPAIKTINVQGDLYLNNPKKDTIYSK